MADSDEAKNAALERLREVNQWFQDALDNRDEASMARAIAAFEAHEAGASYSDVGSAAGVSKTTAIRLVKDGEIALRLRKRGTP